MADHAELLVGVGLCLLLAGVGVTVVASPTHTTEVERSAPSERALANASETPGEIDAVPFEDLAPAEQRAVEGAVAATDGRYTDRGESDGGATLTYRNDVVSQSVVAYEERVYLVRTWLAIDYRLLPVGVGGVLLGLATLGVGVWRWRQAASPSE